MARTHKRTRTHAHAHEREHEHEHEHEHAQRHDLASGHHHGVCTLRQDLGCRGYRKGLLVQMSMMCACVSATTPVCALFTLPRIVPHLDTHTDPSAYAAKTRNVRILMQRSITALGQMGLDRAKIAERSAISYLEQVRWVCERACGTLDFGSQGLIYVQ